MAQQPAARGLENVTINDMYNIMGAKIADKTQNNAYLAKSRANLKNFAIKGKVPLDTALGNFMTIINSNVEPYVTNGPHHDSTEDPALRFGTAFKHMAEMSDLFPAEDIVVLRSMHARLQDERAAAKKASKQAAPAGADSDVGPGPSTTDQDARPSINTPTKPPPPTAGARMAAAADAPAADDDRARISQLESEVAVLKEGLEAMRTMQEEMRAMRQELEASKAEMQALKAGIRSAVAGVNQLLVGAMAQMAL